ncbi:MAG: S8 family serine peptidase [Planctomycetia bacterium]|nr:S8 family serine peptidase [Planctomycetia bacterium]
MQGLSPIGTFFLRAVRSRSRSRFARLAAVAVITTIPVAAFAQEIASPPTGQFLTGPYDPVTGGNFQFVNELVGGSIFYSSGFLGGSTIIGNIEAGHVWGDHEVFNRTGLGIGPAVERQVSAPGVTGQLDFHATMVGHVLAGTGYVAASGTNSGGYSYLGVGMAPHARLWSGAIATSYSTSTSSIGSFDTEPTSTIPVYRQFFQGISGTAADVINSSFGGGDPSSTEPESLAIDALAFQNPNVTFVAAAGNDDTAAVSAPGNVYNGITVGSVGGTNFRTPSDFSSRGAVDFYNPVTKETVTGVRAAVDIAAPGELNVLAAYLGPTGGLVPRTDITQNPSPTNQYFVNQDGTSFASPTVAGGVALMKDAANGLGWMPGTALDSRVIKSVLMATSDRTDGWNNGQATVNGVVRTTQSLDWATGAGALDLETAGLTYVQGNTIDVGGLGGGTIGLQGWDYGSVGVNAFNDYTDYTFSSTLSSPSELQVSLNWFARGAFDNATDTGTRSAFANLDLQVWSIADGVFNSLVAESTSLYNNAEFLRFTLTGAGQYGLRVLSPGMTYDANAATEPVTSETYGLSWNMVVVPEPSAAALAAIGAALAAIMAHRRRS